MKHKITLKPSGNVVEVEEGVNLLEALRSENVYIKSSCGGVASCSDCIVKIVSGEDYITPPPFEELKLLGNVFHITKERLACQTSVTGDVSIDISRHDKVKDENRLKNKTTSFTQKKQIKIRKENDIQKIRDEKIQESIQYDQEKKSKAENWQKHWEKDQSSDSPKKLAGGKRPKFFDTDKVDYEKRDFTRPLSPEKRVEKESKNENLDKDSLPLKEYKKFRN